MRIECLLALAFGVMGSQATMGAAAVSSTTQSPASAPVASTTAITPAPAHASIWSQRCTIPGTPHPRHVVLDATAAPVAERRAVLDRIAHCAEGGSVPAQSFLGALYWMGDALPAALVARDPATAVKYLSNAAAHGDIAGMAKIAEIELVANHPRAAWTWAHLYGHYALPPQASGPVDPDASYAADLLMRTNAALDPADQQAARGDAAAFLAYYGPGIDAYQAFERVRRAAHPEPQVVQRPHLHFPRRDSRPSAGLADFLVEIRRDGTVAHAWDIDAYPSRAMSRLLQAAAMDVRFAASDDGAPRFMTVPIVYHDFRYTIRRHN